MDSEQIILEGAEAKPLVLSALGCPYFLVVQDNVTKNNRTAIRSHISEGFDIGHVFDWLTDYADEDADFRNVLMDFAIGVGKKYSNKM